MLVDLWTRRQATMGIFSCLKPAAFGSRIFLVTSPNLQGSFLAISSILNTSFRWKMPDFAPTGILEFLMEGGELHRYSIEDLKYRRLQILAFLRSVGETLQDTTQVYGIPFQQPHVEDETSETTQRHTVTTGAFIRSTHQLLPQGFVWLGCYFRKKEASPKTYKYVICF